MYKNRLILVFCALLLLAGLPFGQALAGPQSGQAVAVQGDTAQTFRSIDEQDGWVREYGEALNKGGALDAADPTIRLGDDAQNRQYRSILSFNTNDLPDNAVILSATLRLKKQGVTGVDPFTTHNQLAVAIRKPFFGNDSTLELRDFQAAAALDSAGVVAPAPVEGYYVSNLTNGALAYINKGGLTQLRLAFQLGDNNDHNADFVSFYSGDAGPVVYRPALVIRYRLPIITPTQTNTATLEGPTSTATITLTPIIVGPTKTPTITPTITPTSPCFDC